jgi:hypothetical protein
MCASPFADVSFSDANDVMALIVTPGDGQAAVADHVDRCRGEARSYQGHCAEKVALFNQRRGCCSIPTAASAPFRVVASHNRIIWQLPRISINLILQCTGVPREC